MLFSSKISWVQYVKITRHFSNIFKQYVFNRCNLIVSAHHVNFAEINQEEKDSKQIGQLDKGDIMQSNQKKSNDIQ